MKIKDIEKEMIRLKNMSVYENKYSYFNYIAGVDEVGRGCLSGPVVTAAVILDKETIIMGINDSKKISEKNREILYEEILEKALSVNVNFIDEKVIDDINILEATKLSMKNSVLGLSIKPDIVLVDAVSIPDIDIKQISIIKGDANSISISAASIVAKVTRDRYMVELSKKYPEYKWDKNKGYGTKEHREAIEKYGLTDIHRKTFCKNYVK